MTRLLAHADEHANEMMMDNMQSQQACMMNGGWMMALVAVLLVVLIMLGIMGIVVLYRTHFSAKKK